jgi:hypothetical protein
LPERCCSGIADFISIILLTHSKRSWLAHQPINHMTIVNVVFIAAVEPGKFLNQHRAELHLEAFDLDMDISKFTDQSAGHRVGVELDANRTSLADPHLASMLCVNALCRKISQFCSVLPEPLGLSAIAPYHELTDELLISHSILEVAAAAEHQHLINSRLESVMALLGISILMGLTGVDGLSFQAIVRQQGAVMLLEQFTIAKVVHRSRQPSGAVHHSSPSKFPEGALKPLAEALETLGKADRAGLPIPR